MLCSVDYSTLYMNQHEGTSSNKRAFPFFISDGYKRSRDLEMLCLPVKPDSYFAYKLPSSGFHS